MSCGLREQVPVPDPRILYLNTSTGWGGMEMHPLEVARALAQRGSPILFGLRKGSRAEEHSRGLGFERAALRFPWYLDPASLAALRRRAESFGVNVIHIHASRDAWRALVLARMLRTRPVLVFSRHLGSPAGRKKDDPLHRVLVRRLDAMVAVSEYLRQNILETYPIEASRVRVIPYGLGPAVRGSESAARQARRRLEVPEGNLLVGLVAQITPDKCQDLLVVAAARVLDQIPGCTFVLAGAPVDAAYAAEIRARIVSGGLAGRVLLTGFWDDVPGLMRALDVLVLPSKAEAFGLVLLEAMANGRPIVGSNSGAVPEIVRHGENGLVFEPGDAGSLARALLELLRDPDRRQAMGRRGEELFSEKYLLDREAADTEELYRTLLRQQSRRAPVHST
jgi:glycosyltransferase involved in cell wall biosynthesis